MSGVKTYTCYAVKRRGLAKSVKVLLRLFSALLMVAQDAIRSSGSISRLPDISGVNCTSNDFRTAAGRNVVLSASMPSIHGFEGNVAAVACANPGDCKVVYLALPCDNCDQDMAY